MTRTLYTCDCEGSE